MGKLSNIRRTKMLAQGGRCYYCDLPMWDPELDNAVPEICRAPAMRKYLRCTAEHLHPRSDGGADAPANIVAACIGGHCEPAALPPKNLCAASRPRPAASATSRM